MSDRTQGNGLVCFTNCFLVKEDGTLAPGDLWIDERRGVILDAQVRIQLSLFSCNRDVIM